MKSLREFGIFDAERVEVSKDLGRRNGDGLTYAKFWLFRQVAEKRFHHTFRLSLCAHLGARPLRAASMHLRQDTVAALTAA
jgi:hypothetical protein